MTIPEASRLVLQASGYSEGGDIFSLDMGEPIRIYDFARQLIILSGLKPEQDIQIEFIGLREGEKLHEELQTKYEELSITPNSRIRRHAIEKLYFGEFELRLDWIKDNIYSIGREKLKKEILDLANMHPIAPG